MFAWQKKKIVLGSKSPRRKELLGHICPDFEMRIQDVDEVYDPAMDPRMVPEYLAKIKAEALLPTLQENEIILTADTIVLLEGEIIGKPETLEHALEMLQKLNGKRHEVITGCGLLSQEKERYFSVTTEVYFKQLSTEALRYYVEQYKPLDKAGSYGVQEWIGLVGVERIDGSFYNVMGLPVAQLWDELEKF